jgi:hypothetical protein
MYVLDKNYKKYLMEMKPSTSKRDRNVKYLYSMRLLLRLKGSAFYLQAIKL